MKFATKTKMSRTPAGRAKAASAKVDPFTKRAAAAFKEKAANAVTLAVVEALLASARKSPKKDAVEFLSAALKAVQGGGGQGDGETQTSGPPEG